MNDLLTRNETWVETVLADNPGFFATIAEGQSPEYLYIGCSDSRVPIELVTGSKPGDIFVHRNIANQVRLGDTSLESVVQYAVDVLKVKTVIVCGHSRCGGVKAALEGGVSDPIDSWLSGIRDVYDAHRFEIDGIEDDIERVDRLVELQTLAQVENLKSFKTIRDAIDRGEAPEIVACVFRLESGKIEAI